MLLRDPIRVCEPLDSVRVKHASWSRFEFTQRPNDASGKLRPQIEFE